MRQALAAMAIGFLVLGGPTAPAAAAPRPGFGWPLAGMPRVERAFSPPASAYGPGHRGVDLSASWGTPVLSAGPGRVAYAGLLAGRGVVTVVHEGGLRTTYEPVDATVRVGQLVVHGSVLGRLSVGHASCRRVVCLHWGLLRGSVYLDPLGLVVGGPVRLLPVGARGPTGIAAGTAAGVPLSGLRRMRTLVPVAEIPPADRSVGGRLVGVAGATGAVAGGAVLGLMALRRQDARSRPLRRPPPLSRSLSLSRRGSAQAGSPARAP
ncbi:MAG: Peptidase [Frankiales bacterium]|nr:Peptidase [Frankiales bacterium]